MASSSAQGQSMAFTDGDHLSLENKESETFSWQGPVDELTTGDLFEQYLMLDGDDSSAPTAGGESFHELIEAPDMAIFSPLVPPGLTLPPKKSSGGGITNQDAVTSRGSSSHGISSYATNFFQPPPLQNHQQRQMRPRPNMSHHHHQGAMDPRELSMGAYEMPGGGSISDSELLKLKRLDLHSSGVHVPPTSASVPPSPHAQSNSPQKGGSSQAKAIYARLRNKASTAFRGKSRQQQQQQQQQPAPSADVLTPLISTAQMGPGPSRTAGMGRSKPSSLQINKPHLPLSPPLTGSMADMAHQPSLMGGTDNGMQFVNGFLDDPFFDPNGLLVLPQTANNGAAGPNTPLHTPLLSNFTSSAGGEPSTPAIAWQLGPDGKTLWSSPSMPSMPSMARTTANSSFLVAPDGTDNWWDGDAMDTDDMGMDAAVFHQQSNFRNTNVAALNLAMQQLQHQNQQPGGGFEYPLPPGAEDLAASGLMIHMPQPRAPTPAVLHPYYPGTTIPQNGEVNGAGGGNKLQQQQSKRPKPRAPSSGARYHHHHPNGSMTSPRKTRTASGSGASGGRTTPSPSPTQGGADGNGNPNRRLHRRSASMNTLTNHAGPEGGLGPTNPAAIRKRRSWTGRRLGATEAAATAAAVSVGAIPPVPSIPPSLQQQQSQRANNIARRVSSTSSLSSSTTPTTLRRDSSSHHQHHPQQTPHPHLLRNNRSMPQLTLQVPDHHPRRHPKRKDSHSTTGRKHSTTSSSSQPGDGGGGGADLGLGFVNFTPQDHNILMTGVAPSGSSKTKARREKEAAERQRKLSEAVVKAVAAAGGDVRKLEQEGIMLS